MLSLCTPDGVGITGTEFWKFQIDSSDPVVSHSKEGNKMMTDEPAYAGEQDPSLLLNVLLLRICNAK